MSPDAVQYDQFHPMILPGWTVSPHNEVRQRIHVVRPVVDLNMGHCPLSGRPSQSPVMRIAISFRLDGPCSVTMKKGSDFLSPQFQPDLAREQRFAAAWREPAKR